jgi:hypothetical protein
MTLCEFFYQFVVLLLCDDPFQEKNLQFLGRFLSYDPEKVVHTDAVKDSTISPDIPVPIIPILVMV